MSTERNSLKSILGVLSERPDKRSLPQGLIFDLKDCKSSMRFHLHLVWPVYRLTHVKYVVINARVMKTNQSPLFLVVN